MYSPRHCTPIALATSAILGLHDASAADADIELLKAQFQAQFDQLAKRVETLEAENAQLKKQVAAASKPAPSTTAAPPSNAEIAKVEKRVTTLESKAERAGPELKAQSARTEANTAAISKFEESLQSSATETRQIYRNDGFWPFDAKKFYDLAQPFEFHGYLRSGFGMNGEGGKMEAFKAPGAGAKYRLGNEADTYGELGFTRNWLREDDPTADPYVRATAMLSYSSAENFSYESLNNQDGGNDIALRQAYVEAGNVLQNTPEVKFWAGQRYYRRHDININDFYYLDMSGYGGGVEDVPLGDTVKFAAAWLGGSVDDYATDDGDVAKQNIDLRFYDIPVPLGNLTVWLNYANTQGGEVTNVAAPGGGVLDLDSSNGWAVGLIHRTEEEQVFGGYNEFSIQYGRGAAYNFQSTLDQSGPDLGEASRFRITNQTTIQPLPQFAMQAIAVYDDTDYGGHDSHDRWFSLGARPIYYFNDRFSIALETGVDWTKSETLGTDGHLWKITLAPQISRGGKFFSRPVLRAFVTYAKWSEDLKGHVGGSAYENATDGLSYGFHAEAWW